MSETLPSKNTAKVSMNIIHENGMSTFHWLLVIFAVVSAIWLLHKEFSALSRDINSVALQVSKVESLVAANKEILIQLLSEFENISINMASQNKTDLASKFYRKNKKAGFYPYFC